MIVGRETENRVVEILRVLQGAEIEISGRGEEHFSPTTHETIMIMQFDRYTIQTCRIDTRDTYCKRKGRQGTSAQPSGPSR